MRDHELIDERSLAFDCLIAAKLAADPSLREVALRNVDRWLITCSPGVRPVLMEWRGILTGPVETLIGLLSGTDERATRLRQSSPFAGMLSTSERTAVLKSFHRRESNPA